MLAWEGSRENKLYLLMTIYVVILPVPLCNIYEGCGSILVHALTFYYYNNNSCNTGIELSSVQYHSALFSSVQLSGTQH